MLLKLLDFVHLLFLFHPLFLPFLSKNDIEERLNHSREILTNSGAHYVIDTIDELPQVIEDINKKLNYGISPN